jgi:nucleoside-diphosphate-sugar epimerase
LNLLEHRSEFEGSEQLSLIWLAGMGLIGSAVRSALIKNYGFSTSSLAYTWDGLPDQNEMEADEIQKAIIQMVHFFSLNHSGAKIRVKILWVAGRAGFAADEEVLKLELDHYQRVLKRARNLTEALTEAEIGFYLVSSAGGIFEGQRCIDKHSKPQPLRPYGRIKQMQEELLQAENATMSKFIYRPSSVYGDIFQGHRMGLISAMVLSAVNQTKIMISGNLNTLRDYVYAGDVGAFLGRELVEPGNCIIQAPVFLASGRACSILEIRHKVEYVTRRKTYIAFDLRSSNMDDNTYSSHALPSQHWHPVDIETGVARVYAEWCKKGQGIITRT